MVKTICYVLDPILHLLPYNTLYYPILPYTTLSIQFIFYNDISGVSRTDKNVFTD